MKRILYVLLLSLVAVFPALAQQTVTTETEMKFFTGLSVSDDFTVTIRKGDGYGLKTNIDERIDPFVIAYVKDEILYLDIERKKFTPELKKSLRATRTNAPVIEAEVSVPFVKSLEISGNALIKGADDIETDSFVLKASEKSSIANVEVICSNAELNVSKGASVDVEINASSLLQVRTSGTSKTFIKHKGDSLSIASTGTSALEAIIDVKGLVVDNSGMSSIKIVSGKVDGLMVDASGSAKFNAVDVAVPTAYIIQSGSSRSIVNVTDTLKVNLVGNSTLEFKDNPYIDLVKIVSSTLTRYDASSSK